MADQVQLDDIMDLIDNMLPVTAEEPMSSTSILNNPLTKPTMGPGHNPMAVQDPGYNPMAVQGPGYNPMAVQGPGYNPMAVQGPGYNPMAVQSPGYNPMAAQGPDYNSMAMAAIPACSVCRAPGEGSCTSYGNCHR